MSSSKNAIVTEHVFTNDTNVAVVFPKLSSVNFAGEASDVYALKRFVFDFIAIQTNVSRFKSPRSESVVSVNIPVAWPVWCSISRKCESFCREKYYHSIDK